MVKVAVATKSGKVIDEHFGHAKDFKIYEIENMQCVYLESRNVDNYCQGGYSDDSAMPKILDTIQDCAAVFVARIGEGPAEKLSKRGIEAVADYPWSEIEDAIHQYISDKNQQSV